MFFWNGFCEETEDNNNNEDDSKEKHSKVQVVDVLDDCRSLVISLKAADDLSVGTFPGKPNYTNH